MLLAIDVGNTHTCFAVFSGEVMAAQWRLSTNPERTADEYAVLIDRLCEMQAVRKSGIEAVMLSCVVPQTVFQLKKFSRDYIGCEARVVGEAGMVPDMQLAVDTPQEVGADRLVNAFAARTLYGNGVVVLDFGTATTFDVVDGNGVYCGGVIAPGIQLSLQALHKAAAKLPNVAVARPASVIGRNTVSAMQSGVYYGYMGMIDGIILRIRAESATPMQVIATGGLAPLFAQDSEAIDILDGDLTMQGLYLLHQAFSQ